MSLIDYVGLSDYAKAWPDKPIAFICDHCVDDDFKTFMKALWDYCDEADENGPAVSGWLKT